MVSLKKIIPMLESKDYKERLVGEYWFVKSKLKALEKWSATNRLNAWQVRQGEAMAVYIHCLRMQAEKMKVNLASIYGKGEVDKPAPMMPEMQAMDEEAKRFFESAAKLTATIKGENHDLG